MFKDHFLTVMLVCIVLYQRSIQIFLCPRHSKKQIVLPCQSVRLSPSPSVTGVSNLRLSFSGGASMSFGRISSCFSCVCMKTCCGKTLKAPPKVLLIRKVGKAMIRNPYNYLSPSFQDIKRKKRRT